MNQNGRFPEQMREASKESRRFRSVGNFGKEQPSEGGFERGGSLTATT